MSTDTGENAARSAGKILGGKKRLVSAGGICYDKERNGERSGGGGVSKTSAYEKVYEELKEKIRSGRYPVGSLLPTEEEMETLFSVSRTTVRRAMRLLAEDGLAEIRQGRGATVLDFRTIQDLSKVTSVTESLRHKGYRVRTKRMEIDTVPADERLGQMLRLPAGGSLARVQRIQLADEKPVALMTNFIPYDLVPQIETYAGGFSGLYQFLEERYGIRIDAAKDTIWAKSAGFTESEMLAVTEGTALLCIRRLCFSASRPVCLDEVKILGDQYELENAMSGRLK